MSHHIMRRCLTCVQSIRYQFLWSHTNQIPIPLVPYQSDTNYFGPIPIRYQLLWSHTNQIPITLVPYQSDTNYFGPLPIRYQLLWSYTNQIPIPLVLYQSDTNPFGPIPIIYQFLLSYIPIRYQSIWSYTNQIPIPLVLYQSDTNPFGPIPIRYQFLCPIPIRYQSLWSYTNHWDPSQLKSCPRLEIQPTTRLTKPVLHACVSPWNMSLYRYECTAHSLLCFRNVKFPVLMCGLPLNLVSIETWRGRPAERLKQVTSGDREVGGGPARQHLGTTNTNCSSHS